MNFNDINSIKELDIEIYYDTLCFGIKDLELQNKFRKMCKDTIVKYHNLFDTEVFTTKRYHAENNPDGYNALQYVLPTLKRVFSRFFIKTPEVFENKLFTGKLELFQLQFDLEEFLLFFSKKYEKNWNCLQDFENLDAVSEVLTLIVQDYISQKIEFVHSTPLDKIKTLIRDKKIDSIKN
jgi:hypothetical protein